MCERNEDDEVLTRNEEKLRRHHRQIGSKEITQAKGYRVSMSGSS